MTTKFVDTVSSAISKDEALNYLDTFRKFIINNDIPAAINGNANYLAALGLSAYTEIMGGLYCGDLKGELRKHYLSFIQDFFPPDYMKVDGDLNSAGTGLYNIVRNGLTHEYFIKGFSKIVMDSPVGQTPLCGITYNKQSSSQIVFYVNQYFTDFKNAFEQYYEQLKNDTSGSMLKNFENALDSIKSDLIGKLPTDFSKDVSGNAI
jgi:hypothetical protein